MTTPQTPHVVGLLLGKGKRINSHAVGDNTTPFVLFNTAGAQTKQTVHLIIAYTNALSRGSVCGGQIQMESRPCDITSMVR